MMRTLYTGLSGTKVHQTKLDVIGNNISNVNTTGFKSSRTTFSNMLSQNIAGAAAGGAAMGAAGAAAAPAGWTCSCGQAGNQGNYCMNCGGQKPAPAAPAAAGWTCSCGQAGNQGNYCMNCGSAKPAPVACPKCGWQPAPGQPSKFCPECGTQIQ